MIAALKTLVAGDGFEPPIPLGGIMSDAESDLGRAQSSEKILSHLFALSSPIRGALRSHNLGAVP